MADQSPVARDAMLGFGTLLQRQEENGTWTTLAGVMDLDGPDMSAEAVKVTHQESPSATHEYLPGLIEPGTISTTLVYLPGGTAHGAAPGGLAHDFRSRAIRDWRIVWPDAGDTTWSFRGFVTALKPAAPLEDRLTLDVTIQLAAAPTLA